MYTTINYELDSHQSTLTICFALPIISSLSLGSNFPLCHWKVVCCRLVQQVPETLSQGWSCVTLCVVLVHNSITRIQAPKAIGIVLLYLATCPEANVSQDDHRECLKRPLTQQLLPTRILFHLSHQKIVLVYRPPQGWLHGFSTTMSGIPDTGRLMQDL